MTHSTFHVTDWLKTCEYKHARNGLAVSKDNHMHSLWPNNSVSKCALDINNPANYGIFIKQVAIQ